LRRVLVVEENHRAVTPATWTPALISAAKARMRALSAADELRKAKEQALNDLEGYIYKVRNRVLDEAKELKTVSTEQQRQAVLDICQESETWLEDEGQGQEVSVYKSKLSAIRRLAEPIFLRLSEVTARPTAVAKARRALSDVRNKVAEWAVKLPHVTDEEKKVVLEAADRAEKWLDDKEAAQKALASSDEPAFLSDDVPAQLKFLSGQFERLLRKPKPPPEKVNGALEATTLLFWWKVMCSFFNVKKNNHIVRYAMQLLIEKPYIANDMCYYNRLRRLPTPLRRILLLRMATLHRAVGRTRRSRFG